MPRVGYEASRKTSEMQSCASYSIKQGISGQQTQRAADRGQGSDPSLAHAHGRHVLTVESGTSRTRRRGEREGMDTGLDDDDVELIGRAVRNGSLSAVKVGVGACSWQML